MSKLDEKIAFYQNEIPKNLKIIILNNKGGRIFELIDGPSNFSKSLDYQITEHNRSIESICNHFALEYICARNQEELKESIGTLSQSEKACVLEVTTNPTDNKVFFDQFKNITYE